MSMEEIDGGIRIRHEREHGGETVVEAEYNEKTGRLLLMIDGIYPAQVELNMEESGYFMATIAWWYDKGGD